MINKALKVTRQYHELNVTSLADKLNIPCSTLRDIESGKRPINSELLQQYSNIFDIPVSSLVFFSESIVNEGKVAKKFRLSLAGKILKVANWLAEKDEKIKA